MKNSTRQWILSCNAGSSTLKLGLYHVDDNGQSQRAGRGQIDLRLTPVVLQWRTADTAQSWPLAHIDSNDMSALLDAALGLIEEHHHPMQLSAIGHRVVHGGLRYYQPQWLDEAVLADLDSLGPLAPLHQPPALRIIRAIAAARPQLRQAALFDTAFHHGHADHISRMAIPRALHSEGVRRYGFHGLSYQAISEKLKASEPALWQGKIIVAHLGSGASLCAMQAGQSRDTSMGFSALDGIPMATRPGALDSGVLLYLLQQGMDAAALENWLYRECGMLGASGISADTRVLAQSDAPEAAQALTLFCFRTAREICALANSLGGIDGLVFTAGIGEHQANIRAGVCAYLHWLGLRLDTVANNNHERIINSADSRIAVRVIATDEERIIANGVHQLLQQDS